MTLIEQRPTPEPAVDGSEKTAEPSRFGEVTLSGSLGCLLAVIGFAIGSRPLSDNSFLTHLATGNLSRTLGHVPSIDSYSYTAPGESWTVQSWLISLVYSYLSDVAQGSAIRIFNGLIVALTVALIWRLTCSARPVLSRIVLMSPVLVVASAQWTSRPLLVGILGLVVVLCVLQQQLSPLWLVPMMWIWINSHGSFPLAFVLVGVFGIGQLLDDLVSEQRVFRAPIMELRTLAWVGLGTLGGMINPIGPRLLLFPFQLLRNGEALDGVAEWQAPGFETTMEVVFLGLVAAVVVAARVGAPWRLLLPSIVFSASAFLAVRNVGGAVVVLTVCLASTIRMKGSLSGNERGVLPLALMATAAVAGMAWTWTVIGAEALRLDAYPTEEVDWLEANGLVAQRGVNLVHRDYVGNYLDFRFGAEARIFVDDRFDFFPQQVLDDHSALLGGGDGDYASILQRYNASVVLWESDTGLAAWLRESSEWIIGYESDDWIVALPA